MQLLTKATTDTSWLTSFFEWAWKEHPEWSVDVRGDELWCENPSEVMHYLSCWIHAWYAGRQMQLREDSKTVREQFAEVGR